MTLALPLLVMIASPAIVVDRPANVPDTTAAITTFIDAEDKLADATPQQPQSSPSPTLPDIVVVARPKVPGDPLAAVNVRMFQTTQAVDRAVVGPAADAYERVVPRPMRSGLRNFFNNLHEPVVFVNYLLQLKPGKAAETVGRFLINSTIGAAGLFDVAKTKPFNLPRRKNGFSDTLGFYGVKPGPFLFLPLIGPTTLRDLLGGIVDRGVMPLYLGMPPFTKPEFGVVTGGVRMLDRRAEGGPRIDAERATGDPYAAARTDYLSRRSSEIEGLRGKRQPPPAASPAPTAPPAVRPTEPPQP